MMLKAGSVIVVMPNLSFVAHTSTLAVYVCLSYCMKSCDIEIITSDIIVKMEVNTNDK